MTIKDGTEHEGNRSGLARMLGWGNAGMKQNEIDNNQNSTFATTGTNNTNYNNQKVENNDFRTSIDWGDIEEFLPSNSDSKQVVKPNQYTTSSFPSPVSTTSTSIKPVAIPSPTPSSQPVANPVAISSEVSDANVVETEKEQKKK